MVEMPDVLAILNRPSVDAPAHDPGAPPFHLADVSLPHLSVLDLSATRGDGIFETLSVFGGRPQALEPHLDRFARSAVMLDLPTPDLGAWRQAVLAVIVQLGPMDEALVKIILSRGVEGGERPTGWAYASPAPDFTEARTRGIRVVVLDRGLRHDVASTSPWLLAGAKTLSYAVNKAALREAARRAADDVVFVSSDGILLEGPTSTLVYRRGDTLLTPPAHLGILEGTTQANVFRFADGAGLQTAVEIAGPDALRSADAAWLVSSVRLAAPIRCLEGQQVPVDVELTAAMNDYLLGLPG
ncbi:MAG: aminotransferase class IV [Salinibacterium sp.]|nr:aminotransferase class IV [Salinibacterium sp.]